MSKPRVLISGASVAGPALAYWLVRAGCSVTIVERSPILRKAGQGVDVRDSARDVIRRMGIFDTMRDKSSQEQGLRLVDKDNHTIASFAADFTSGEGASPTCDIEILRGELAGILYDVTKDDVSYIFGDSVESIEEAGAEVIVTFANSTPRTSFDLVVAADGIGSKTRNIAFGKDAAYTRSLNAYVTYFSIPPGDTDTQWARVHLFKKGRNISVRPDNVGRTRAFLCVTAYDSADSRLPLLEEASKKDISAQKAITHSLFQDADWETARFLKGMHESDDLYMQHIAQVKMNHWSKGRVTVVGDAGYAPSPMTGMGTSLAFIGAYVLAGEISKQMDDIPAALESYERVLRPYVESVQKLPPGIPWIVNPQTGLGIKVMETVAWGISLVVGTKVGALLSKVTKLLPVWNDEFKLPEYEAFKR